MFIGMVLSAPGCKNSDNGSSRSVQTIITQLETTPRKFVVDGACDFHVEVDVRNVSPNDVLALVSMLGSDRPTQTTFRRYEKEVCVPLGYLVLDLLLLHTPRSSIAYAPSGGSGDFMWNDVRPDLYFPPDVLMTPGGQERMQRVQAAWLALVNRERLTFVQSK
jgi:hypothetical protein